MSRAERPGLRRRAARSLVAVALVTGVLVAGAAPSAEAAPKVKFWLTVLHNNDGESKLIDAGTGLEDFGGIARFATLVNRLRRDALDAANKGAVLVSSGDNYLAGPQLAASFAKGPPFYDTLGLDRIGYDAFAIGNHEFDFGPDVLADFISGFTGDAPFLSSNLNLAGEPSLDALADAGRIAKSVIVTTSGRKIGIIGATTPMLPFISSPRDVLVNPNVAGAIQKQVNRLLALGVNKIVLISHLQSIEEDLALAPMLKGVDVMVAGGGDELLANPRNVLIPGDEGSVFGPYPLWAADADGKAVPVITTSGDYRYLGKLVVGFDGKGNVVRVLKRMSGPQRVVSRAVFDDGVNQNRWIKQNVVDPVAAFVADLAANVIADSAVPLDGIRADVRSMETNEGNLIADALFWQAQQSAAEFGAPMPDIALQNGGGIRNNTLIPPGPITELDTFSMVPFA
ncbi:MAG: 5'-nucleotidase C-terminal domain-containing protein, partial [Actinobacteria bacterium]|nr:5'-nucleotidase C-terminal domain-containing protein [Actinomycetota bacterium]